MKRIKIFVLLCVGVLMMFCGTSGAADGPATLSTLIVTAAASTNASGPTALSGLITELANGNGVTIDQKCEINGNATIDLNGKTITVSVSSGLTVAGGNVTIKNGNIEANTNISDIVTVKGGTLTLENINVSVSNGAALWVTGTGLLTLKGGRVESTPGKYALIAVNGTGTLVVDGAELYGGKNNALSVYGSGNCTISGAKAKLYSRTNVDGGNTVVGNSKYECDITALRVREKGTITINGGFIEGPNYVSGRNADGTPKSSTAAIWVGNPTEKILYSYDENNNKISADQPGGTIIFNGGEIKADYFDECQGINAGNGGKVIIKDGVIRASSAAVSAAQDGQYMAAVDISGGFIIGDVVAGATKGYQANFRDNNITIRGGNIDGELLVIMSGDNTPKGNITVTGGFFTKIPGYIASGYTAYEQNADGYRVISTSDYEAMKAAEKANEIMNTMANNENLQVGTALGDALMEILKEAGTSDADADFGSEELLATVAAIEAIAELPDDLQSELSSLGQEQVSEMIRKDVNNKKEERAAAKQEEASGEVADTKTPAGTDLIAKSETASPALKTANESLSAQPKVITPTAVTTEGVKTMANNLSLLETSKVTDSGIDAAKLNEIKAAAESLQPAKNIEIEESATDLASQAEVLESVFDDVSENLANVPNAGGGTGVVVASVLPKMTPKVSGFFPLKINLRNLTLGRRLLFWPSTAYFNNYADRANISSVSLAADDDEISEGKEGDFFFLDENQVPVTKVTGDASKMTVVAYLEEDGDYSSAFITADATEKDVAALETLAADSSSGGGDSKPETPGGGDSNPSDGSDNNNGGGAIPENPSGGGDDGRGGTDDGSGDSSDSSGSGGGCDLGFSVWALAALMLAFTGSKFANKR